MTTHTLGTQCSHATEDGTGRGSPLIPVTAHALNAHPSSRHDPSRQTLIPETTHSLRSEGADASEDGTGRGTPLVPVGFTVSAQANGFAWTKPYVGALQSHPQSDTSERQSGVVVPIAFHSRQDPVTSEQCLPLEAKGGQCVAVHENQRAEVTLSSTVGALKVSGGKPGQGYPCVAVQDSQSGVRVSDVTGSLRADSTGFQPLGSLLMQPIYGARRIMPVEAEKLQGFPPGYTNIPGASDSQRYKSLGNSMAVPVMRWIGERIKASEEGH